MVCTAGSWLKACDARKGGNRNGFSTPESPDLCQAAAGGAPRCTKLACAVSILCGNTKKGTNRFVPAQIHAKNLPLHRVGAHLGPLGKHRCLVPFRTQVPRRAEEVPGATYPCDVPHHRVQPILCLREVKTGSSSNKDRGRAGSRPYPVWCTRVPAAGVLGGGNPRRSLLP